MKWVWLAFIIICIISFSLGRFSKEDDTGKKSEINVFAAASLTESLTDIANEFEKLKGTKVYLNFAGSQALAASIENGAKADIFISASSGYMDSLKEKGFIKEYKIFLKNRLILIENRNSRFNLKSLSDLSAEGLKIAVGDKSVPVGSYWEKALDRALGEKAITPDQREGIQKNIKTWELSVKDIESKVLLNEADVGVVYTTDVTGKNESKVCEIELPEFKEITASYPIAVLYPSEKRTAVNDFYQFILSEKGMRIFTKYKFIT